MFGFLQQPAARFALSTNGLDLPEQVHEAILYCLDHTDDNVSFRNNYTK